MNELRSLDDDRLGQALAAVGAMVAWPAGPDVAGSVVETIRAAERRPSLVRPRLSLPSRRRTLALVAAAVLLVAGAALATKLVIDIGVVTIEVVPGRPTALPSAVASGPSFGRPTTLAEAEATAGFRARVPAALGPPDRVWVQELADGTRIVLAWRPSASLPRIADLPWGGLLYEFRGNAAVATKVLYAQGNEIRPITVDGRRGYWLTGPHELDLVGPDGSVERIRVTGNVLVWQTAPITLRLETALGREQAVRVAESAG